MADDELKPYMLFTLTYLIGKKATDRRTTVIATVETPLRTAFWLFGTFIVSGGVAAILGLATPLGTWAILIPMLATPAVTAFANGRSRRGLQLTHMRRTIDQLNAHSSRGLFIHMDRLYDPFEVKTATITSSTVDVSEVESWPALPTIDAFELDEMDANPADDAHYRNQAERRMSTRSARGAAEERTLFSAALMEAEREVAQHRHAIEYEQHAKARNERIARGEAPEEVAA